MQSIPEGLIAGVDQAGCGSLAWSAARSDRFGIDAMNILHAAILAMRRAILRRPVMPDRILADGNRLPGLRCASRTLLGDAVVGGDAHVPAISAASTLARTERDPIMTEMDERFPGYEFVRHKGCATEVHRACLGKQGPCTLHRQSVEPVRILRTVRRRTVVRRVTR